MIEVKNLTKRYGNHLAVDHLNFTVESGKIYGKRKIIRRIVLP